MGLPNKQIGWSQESNLLWEVLRQVTELSKNIAGSGGGVQNIFAGSYIDIDNSDPSNPVISSVPWDLQAVLTEGNFANINMTIGAGDRYGIHGFNGVFASLNDDTISTALTVGSVDFRNTGISINTAKIIRQSPVIMPEPNTIYFGFPAIPDGSSETFATEEYIERMYVKDPTKTAYTRGDLNTNYSHVKPGFTVFCPDILTGGRIYQCTIPNEWMGWDANEIT